jgi:membrane protease YdiL (CAAX protease family)
MNKRTAGLTATVLFLLGLIGVFSMLLSEFNLDFLPEETVEKIPSGILPYLLLINPTLLLLLLTVAGGLTYRTAGFRVPVIESLVGQRDSSYDLGRIVVHGLVGGVIAGAVILVLEAIFTPFLPEDYLALSVTMTLEPITRFLYGGITEEVITRFGAMSFIVFILSKLSGGLKGWNYWLAIAITAVLFGLGHLPMLNMAIQDPPATLITFIILGNAAAGAVFGWLYWKRGLEAAIIAHMMAHVVMLLGAEVYSVLS